LFSTDLTPNPLLCKGKGEKSGFPLRFGEGLGERSIYTIAYSFSNKHLWTYTQQFCEKSGSYWVALCLDNGIIGQSINKEVAIKKLNEAIASFLEVYKMEPNISYTSVSIE
jgi:hypothetical protein